jgi:hypothetical protein
MAEKVAKIGISREKDMMYYLKGADNLVVWATPRKKPGQTAKGKAQKIQDGGIARESGYLYFIDADGDIARAKRQVGGSKRKKGAKSAPKKAKKSSGAKKGAKKSSSAKKGAKKSGGKKGKKR